MHNLASMPPEEISARMDNLYNRLVEAQSVASLLSHVLLEVAGTQLAAGVLSACGMLERHLQDMVEEF